MKIPSFMFFGGLKRATMNFLSLSELGYECKESGFRIVRLHLTKLAKWNLREILLLMIPWAVKFEPLNSMTLMILICCVNLV